MMKCAERLACLGACIACLFCLNGRRRSQLRLLSIGGGARPRAVFGNRRYLSLDNTWYVLRYGLRAQCQIGLPELICNGHGLARLSLALIPEHASGSATTYSLLNIAYLFTTVHWLKQPRSTHSPFKHAQYRTSKTAQNVPSVTTQQPYSTSPNQRPSSSPVVP